MCAHVFEPVGEELQDVLELHTYLVVRDHALHVPPKVAQIVPLASPAPQDVDVLLVVNPVIYRSVKGKRVHRAPFPLYSDAAVVHTDNAKGVTCQDYLPVHHTNNNAEYTSMATRQDGRFHPDFHLRPCNLRGSE
jgi:hypothetical protein